MSEVCLDLNEIRDAVGNAAARHDVLKVYLFGSYARGEATESSDVDLCLETGPSFSLFSAGDFSNVLEKSLGTPIDMVTERSVFPFVRDAMMQDRVLIYERN